MNMPHLLHKLDFCAPEAILSALAMGREEMLIPDLKAIDGLEEARAHCEAHDLFSGGHKLVALLVLEPKVSPTAQKAIEKLRLRIGELQERIKTLTQPDAEGRETWKDALMAEILERTKGNKSKLKTCEACDSKVAVAHLSGFVCPVCKSEDFLLTTTDSDKIRSREDKITAARSDLAAASERLAAEERQALEGADLKKVWAVFGAQAGPASETIPEGAPAEASTDVMADVMAETPGAPEEPADAAASISEPVAEGVE
jgi:Zn finger protein HypA/HybF involved in hydrogenase expression